MGAILIVDDVPDIRLFCRVVLEGGGHEVTEASTVDEAIKALESTPLDGVLLDIRLFDREGWDVLKVVRDREDLRGTRVIVCSAHAGPGDQRRAVEEGAAGFLGKPFMPKELLRVFAPE
ncbi:MAG TPA: response regulator [Nocardioidaceae bacterium]|nr:response regulator [Nocardioidaceae bacterium]